MSAEVAVSRDAQAPVSDGWVGVAFGVGGRPSSAGFGSSGVRGCSGGVGGTGHSGLAVALESSAKGRWPSCALVTGECRRRLTHSVSSRRKISSQRTKLSYPLAAPAMRTRMRRTWSGT